METRFGSRLGIGWFGNRNVEIADHRTPTVPVIIITSPSSALGIMPLLVSVLKFGPTKVVVKYVLNLY